MRARHQSNRWPAATVYGSPSRLHPPMHASNSPNGRRRRRGAAPRRLIRPLQHAPSATAFQLRSRLEQDDRARRLGERYAAMPPPAPEPDDGDVVHEAARLNVADSIVVWIIRVTVRRADGPEKVDRQKVESRRATTRPWTGRGVRIASRAARHRRHETRNRAHRQSDAWCANRRALGRIEKWSSGRSGRRAYAWARSALAAWG